MARRSRGPYEVEGFPAADRGGFTTGKGCSLGRVGFARAKRHDSSCEALPGEQRILRSRSGWQVNYNDGH